MSTEGNNFTIAEVYKEVGNNYRHFLEWRTKYLTAYFGIVSALGASIAWLFENKENSILWLPSIIGCFVTLIVLILDIRTRQLYHSCQKIGKKIENENGISGIYSELFEDVKKLDKAKKCNALTISNTLKVLLWFLIFLFLSLSIYFVITN